MMMSIKHVASHDFLEGKEAILCGAKNNFLGGGTAAYATMHIVKL